MSSEPKNALDAILETGDAHAFTLARWAMIQKFASGKEQENPIRMLFIMYAPTEAIVEASESEERFNELSFSFADTIPAERAERMMEAAIRKVQDANYMVQESTSQGKKKAQAMDS